MICMSRRIGQDKHTTELRVYRFRKSNRTPSGYLLVLAVSLFLMTGIVGFVNAIAHAGDQGFRLHENPVFLSGQKGAWDASEVDPGAVVFHDGKFHMFYNGLKSYLVPYSVGYATSEDGINWTRAADDPVLTLSDVGLKGENIIANSVLIADDGTWTLYFSISPTNNSFIGTIGRATASSPFGPWRADPEPVLAPGEDGDWDARAVGHVSVLRTSEEYVMYYTGAAPIPVGTFSEERAMIGLARSKDGKVWEKHDDPETTAAPYSRSDPVFRADATAGAWDNWHVMDVDVRRGDDGWNMVYRGGTSTRYGNLGLATSKDGVNWQRVSKKPILTNRDINEPGIFFTNYLRQDGRDFIWLEAGRHINARIYLLTRP